MACVSWKHNELKNQITRRSLKKEGDREPGLEKVYLMEYVSGGAGRGGGQSTGGGISLG